MGVAGLVERCATAARNRSEFPLSVGCDQHARIAVLADQSSLAGLDQFARGLFVAPHQMRAVRIDERDPGRNDGQIHKFREMDGGREIGNRELPWPSGPAAKGGLFTLALLCELARPRTARN